MGKQSVEICISEKSDFSEQFWKERDQEELRIQFAVKKEVAKIWSSQKKVNVNTKVEKTK